MIYTQLFLGCLKVGCFAFGGAYGAIPLIRDVVSSYGWLSEERLTDMIAISESTPGPIMVNLATYVGSSQAGIVGAAIATLTVILPAFLIILIVVKIMERFMKNRWIKAAMKGIVACVTGVIVTTGACMIVENVVPQTGFDLRALIITGILGAALLIVKLMKKKISPILLIVISAISGAIVYGI